MLTSRKPHILFIGHEASVSGAPILLLNLMLLLQRENTCKITLVVRRGGAYLPVYQRHFPAIVLKGMLYGKEKNILKRCINIVINRIKIAQLLISASSCDVIFSNTIINGRLLKILSIVKKPVITYVHELENVIEIYLGKGDSLYSLKLSTMFAYPSDKVRELLIKKYNIHEGRLLPLSYYFPVSMDLLQNEKAKNTFTNAFKSRFDLHGQDLLVCGMGLASTRKGTDLFLEVCEKVVKVKKTIKFCWIGKFEDAAMEHALTKRIREGNLSEHMVFTGAVDHHYYNLAPFDLFFLSSREDPYPLVVLEAAFMQVPAMCFEPSGGITEFIGADAGWVIPGYSTEHAVDMILYLSERKELLQEKGKKAFQKSIHLHSSKQLITDQFNTLLSSI